MTLIPSILVPVGCVRSSTNLRGSPVTGIYRTLVVLLLVMAVLFTVVGGLSLTSAMGLNVVEQSKEIGVPCAMC